MDQRTLPPLAERERGVDWRMSVDDNRFDTMAKTLAWLGSRMSREVSRGKDADRRLRLPVVLRRWRNDEQDWRRRRAAIGLPAHDG